MLFFEFKKTLALAIPMMIGQFVIMSMGLVDAAMVGRGLDTSSLAALGFGVTLVNLPIITGFGFTNSISVLVARSLGKNDEEEAGDVLRHGIITTLSYGMLAIIALLIAVEFFDFARFFKQAPDVVELAKPYIRLYSLSYLFMYLFTCFKVFSEAHHKPWIPFGVLLSAWFLNILLNWIFIYGKLGAPQLKLEGAGLATLLCSVFSCSLMLGIVFYSKKYTLSIANFLKWKFKRRLFYDNLAMGIPSSIVVLAEMGAFEVTSLMMGSLGKVELAAHHIVQQLAGLCFMIPLGMSFAIGIRISHSMGAKNYAKAKRIAFVGIVSSAIIMLLAALFLFCNRNIIPTFLSTDPAVVQLASKLILVVVCFQIFDGLQVSAMGALRGLSDVKIPSIAVLLIYWVIAIPLAYGLGFHTKLEGIGIWMALAISLFIACIFNNSRFIYLINKKAKI